MVRRTGSSAVSASFFAAGVAVLLALTGCTGTTTATPSPSAPESSAPASPTPSAPAAIALVPGGTAEQNLPYFDQVNRATLAANPDAKGRDFIDALVAAGFSKSDMQLTVDTTTIGLKANSIQFAVRMGDTCLIGQNGADAGGYWSQAVPVLPTGTCLIGQTRPIDW
ncbi:DUF6993 domain-containing protein [Leifsonia poae]|uniref:DUF6993 domain-containing protein n=1 Tax=Leifsonia poae TaxID=110933 RepID=UPI003D693775